MAIRIGSFDPMVINLLSDPLFHHTVLAAVLSGITCGIIGVLVVVKRMSNIAGSVAHSAFGGIGLSVYFGFPPLVGALAFGWISGLLMAIVRQKYKQNDDILIGMIWVVGMSIGLLALHFSTGYTADLFGLLFGNLLLVTPAELWAIGIWNVILIGFIVGLFRMIQAIVFDELHSTVSNLPVRTVYYALISAISISTVLLIKAVGIILVIALITIPAAVSLNMFSRFYSVVFGAILVSMSATIIGILASFLTDIPTAPVIVGILMSQYFLSLVARRRLD